MPKKNSIGAVLLTVGLILSASLYCLIWMVWPNSVTQNIEIQLHDTYIVLSPLFVFVGIASVILNLSMIVIQLIKRFKVNTWNYTHVFGFLFLGGFLFYGREVLRFGFILLGRLMANPTSSFEQIEQLTSSPSRWEILANNLPEIILVALGLLLIILICKIFIRSKNTAQ